MAAASKKRPSPARAKSGRAGPEGTTEARIGIIADMMRTLRFRRGRTAKRLAVEWGLSLSRVQKLTAAASKRVLEEFKDPERVSVKIGAALERIVDDEMAKAPKHRQARNVIEAGKVMLELAGAMGARRHELSGPNGGPIGCTPDEARRAMQNIFGSVTPPTPTAIPTTPKESNDG